MWRGGEVYAPYACVRGRELAERCERGMDGEVCGAANNWQSIPLAPLRSAKGGDSSLRSE